MGQLKRVAVPFRFHVPEDLIPKLRKLRALQRDWSALIDPEDVVHLYFGLGPARFLAFDGRVLVDPSGWDETDAYEVSDQMEAWSAIVFGAEVSSFPELLRLLPNRAPNARNCSQCEGAGWVSWVDAVGKERRVVCWDCCGGLGWEHAVAAGIP